MKNYDEYMDLWAKTKENKKKRTCLLIKLQDGREFFTHEKNFNYLIEFSKTMNAELSKVEIESSSGFELIPLEDLGKYISDQRYTNPVSTYTVLKSTSKPQRIIVPKLKISEKPSKKSDDVRNIIMKTLLDDKVLKIKDFIKEFDVSSSTLYRHINWAKSQLAAAGRNIERVGVGEYKIV